MKYVQKFLPITLTFGMLILKGLGIVNLPVMLILAPLILNLVINIVVALIIAPKIVKLMEEHDIEGLDELFKKYS